MKLHRPNATPGSSAGGGNPFGPSKMTAPGRPAWLKEWIANQHQYALLKCGCKTDLTERGMLIIRQFGQKQVDVYCERCNAFKGVVRTMKFREYANITYRLPDEPLF